MASVVAGFLASCKSIVNMPFHVAQIRDDVSYANICRIYWVFSRLTITEALTVADNLQLIEMLDNILGTHTDVDKIIAFLQAPVAVINYFSVGFFLVRFMIDAGLLLKHTFFPTEEEKKTNMLERFKHELYKRHCNFANDLSWATVNFLTNFNQISKIPGPVGGFLVAAFLCFDLALIIYKRNLAHKEYLDKKAQYTQELNDYRNMQLYMDLTEEQRRVHILVLTKQINELDMNWQAKESVFYFSAGAAVLLATGFTASLLIASPMLVPLCYFVCTVGIAMYMSSGAYEQYALKSLILQQIDLANEDRAIALKEFEIARREFFSTLTKHILVPLILVTTFAICWPAAIVLTALYLGYEVCHAYVQYSESQAVKRLEFKDDALLLNSAEKNEGESYFDDFDEKQESNLLLI